MKITREIKTAILVIVAILLFVWGYHFLKGKDLFNDYKTYYVSYDNVEGLTGASQITLNGLNIGKVSEISIDPKTAKVFVTMQIKTDFPISRSSVALLYEPGFIGGKQIAIVPNTLDKTLAEDGQTFEGEVKKGLTDAVAQKLVPLQIRIEKLMDNANQMLVSVNNVLDKNSQSHLKNTISELDQTMAQLHKLSNNVNTLVDSNKKNIDNSLANINKTTENFSKISSSLEQAQIGKLVSDLKNTMASVDVLLQNMKNGKGTMGKMLNDDAMYKNLTKTSQELALLLQDVRLNPTRYVNVSLFGKKNKPYIAPVNDTIKK